MDATTTRLTDEERLAVAMARMLAGMTSDEVCVAGGHDVGIDSGAYAFGRVKPLLLELVATISRLDGDRG